MAPFLQSIRPVSWSDERGQDLVEYAMIIVLVIVGVVVLLSALGDVLVDAYYTLAVEAFGP